MHFRDAFNDEVLHVTHDFSHTIFSCRRQLDTYSKPYLIHQADLVFYAVLRNHKILRAIQTYHMVVVDPLICIIKFLLSI